MSGEWIEWRGGDCPVDGERRVDVRFRGSEKLGEPEAYNKQARYFNWRHTGIGSDIIAYRGEQP